MANGFKIRTKLLVFFGGITLLSLIGLAAVNYTSTQNTVRTLIEQSLLNSTKSIENHIHQSIKNYLMDKANNTLQIVEYYYRESLSGRLSEQEAYAAVEDLMLDPDFGIIGTTGYLAGVDTSGTLVIHPSAQGANIIDETFMQTATEMKNGYLEYIWNRPGMDGKYPKAGGLAYFEPWDLIVWASSYKDEFIDLVNLDEIATILASSDFENAYSFIIDNSGEIILHSRTELIGMNISEIQDENGDYFAKQFLESDKGFVEYLWKTSETAEATTRLAAFTLISDMNWTIVISIPKDEAFGLIKNLKFNFIILFIISITIVIAASLLISRNLMGIIQTVINKLKNISSGQERADLSQRLAISSHDEMGEIADGVNQLITKLNNDMIDVKQATHNLESNSQGLTELVEVRIKNNIDGISYNIDNIDRSLSDQTSGIEQVNATLEEIARNIDSINNSIQRQVTAVEESAGAIEEMSRNIDAISVTSNKTMTISNDLNKVATEGGTSVKESISSIRDVSEYSLQILKMLKLITDISKQTNLLAMNASIEAAHAGEAGKGFAIVADEIRRLAESTSKNAKEIKDVVNSIVDKIDDSVSLSEKAGVGLEMIMTYSNQNVQMISQLNTTMEEQNYTIKDILTSIQEIVNVTEEVKISMQEQKEGINEFGETIRNLRSLSIDNKDSVQNHFSNLNELINSMDDLKHISQETDKMSRTLASLLNRFILDESADSGGETQTAMKLVE